MCGLFGIYEHSNAVALTETALKLLQHRGQESVGIASSEHGKISHISGMGMVLDVLTSQKTKQIQGNTSIGHVLYSTSGTSTVQHAQPFVFDSKYGQIALAHNGHLTNATVLREELEKNGAVFQSNSDTEIIVHLLAQSSEKNTIDRFLSVFKKLEGAYSLLALTEDSLIVARDPYGFRPLSMGILDGKTMVSSETCTFLPLGGDFVRDVNPGEMIVINEHGIKISTIKKISKPAYCSFESIYFARPDSLLYGNNVYAVRERLGKYLAQKHPIKADVVIGVPDSALPTALGYAQESNIPYSIGFVRSPDIGRTFIEPNSEIRRNIMPIKLRPIQRNVEGKSVVLVDDSLVRGTTMNVVVNLLKEVGAREVHVRISSPPMIASCHYGIDTLIDDDLIASRCSIDEIMDYIMADSLAYLSTQDMLKALDLEKRSLSYCTACFTGEYPKEAQPDLVNLKCHP